MSDVSVMDPKYYHKQCQQQQEVIDFIMSDDWRAPIERLTDNLRQVLEQIYEVELEDTSDRIVFRFDEATGTPRAALIPFKAVNVHYDNLLDKPNIEVGGSEDICTTVRLSEGKVHVSAVISVPIPKSVMGLLEDCGLVETTHHGFDSRYFKCGVGKMPF